MNRVKRYFARHPVAATVVSVLLVYLPWWLITATLGRDLTAKQALGLIFGLFAGFLARELYRLIRRLQEPTLALLLGVGVGVLVFSLTSGTPIGGVSGWDLAERAYNLVPGVSDLQAKTFRQNAETFWARNNPLPGVQKEVSGWWSKQWDKILADLASTFAPNKKEEDEVAKAITTGKTEGRAIVWFCKPWTNDQGKPDGWPLAGCTIGLKVSGKDTGLTGKAVSIPEKGTAYIFEAKDLKEGTVYEVFPIRVPSYEGKVVKRILDGKEVDPTFVYKVEGLEVKIVYK